MTKVDCAKALVYEDMEMKFVAQRIYDQYKTDEGLELFDIFHIFPGRTCLSQDQHTTNEDSCSFTLWGFNTELDTKVKLGEFEYIDIGNGARVDAVFIYADGSTYMHFSKSIRVERLGTNALVRWM